MKVKYGQYVEEINSTNEKVQVKTQNHMYHCKHVICTIPLIYLKNRKMNFIPPLSHNREKLIDDLGWGIMNKIILSFNKPFWPSNTRRMKFACEEKGKYSHFVNLSEGSHYILCCFVTNSFNKKLENMTD